MWGMYFFKNTLENQVPQVLSQAKYQNKLVANQQ